MLFPVFWLRRRAFNFSQVQSRTGILGWVTEPLVCCQTLSVKLGWGGILHVKVLRLIVHLEAGWD